MLGYLYPSYVRQKRMKLYRNIVRMLSSEKLRKDVMEISKGLEEFKITLEPTMLNTHEQINLNTMRVEDDDFYL